ncbi:methyl-accepting chemotaxis protein [Photobacterium atrarenae]|uniref:Methyl-accepting chemotaxis protein n=1 Tax=Photobacterium atrarenae TaxID=865757 RepID=A0ABY5GKV1_9GAMM|nr:methyl-accepting chemotaxis protein [Photobacterium atrarenae]UTV29944.1 methyl-accepting chemotaxis protein [Photobacterium atrarenae]
MNLSIKNKLALTFAGIILLTATIQIWLTRERLTEETTRSTQELAQSLTQSNISTISQWLDNKSTIVRAAVKGFHQSAEPIPALAQAMDAGQFDLVYVGTKQGKMITGTPVTFPDGYDPRQRPWYQAATAKNGLIVTKPYQDAASGKLIVSLAEPFSAAMNSGIIAGDVSIEMLVSDILAIEQEGVYASLFSRDGTIIAHPDKSLTLKPTTDMGAAFDSAFIQQAAASSAMETLNVSGVESLISIKQVPGTDWYFSLIIDKSLAFAPVQEALTDALISAVVQLLLTLAIATFLISKALKPLDTLSEAMADLSHGNGDLTRRIQFDKDDEIGRLSKHVNAFIEKLHRAVSGISGSSDQLSQQAKSSHNLALQTNEALSLQVNEISQIATAIHQMSATAQEVASHAEQTAGAAVASQESCNEGKEVILRNQQSITDLADQVENASGIIKELEHNAQGINAILSTIQDIAEQTNLLALNAAIEAARAGEQGRGFAVVADEVRVLSQRTHSSTEEIRGMIETLQRNTHNAVETMSQSQDLATNSVDEANNATRALEQITTSIQEISDMATQISSAAEEQRAVTDEISRNTQAVNDVSDQLSGEANEAQRLSEELNDIAQHLNSEVSKFRI